MTYPGIIFWLLLIWGVRSRGPLLLFMLLGSLGVTTLAVVPPAVTGGVTVTASSVFGAAFIAKTLLERGVPAWMISAALRLEALAVLAAFMTLGLVSAGFYPRLFAGTPVIAFRQTGPVDFPAPLAASAANLTQTAYLMLSVLLVFCFAQMARRPNFLPQLMNGFMVAGAVMVVTGLMDLVADRLGLSALLVPFRNATYTLLTDDNVLGAKRVVGLMTEASAYGPTCLSVASVLALLRPYFPAGRRRQAAGGMAIACLTMSFLSTSSTALVGLAVFATVYAADWLRRLADRAAPGHESVATEFNSFASLGLGVLLVISFDYRILHSTVTMVYDLVFEKTASSSYAVRSTWTRVAWQAMLDTNGMGVGVGSARSSNWVIAVFSNTGILGGALMGLFIVQTLLRRASGGNYIGGAITSLKFAMIAPLATMTLSSTVPDFGLVPSVIFGTITGLSMAYARAPRGNAPAWRRAMPPASSPDGPPQPAPLRSLL